MSNGHGQALAENFYGSSFRHGVAFVEMQGEMKRWERLVWWGMPLAVFLLTWPLLWYHAGRGLSFHDSGEFALAAMSAGVPHPPGAPTWTILASLFCRLGSFSEPARATNLFSALCAAVALGLWSALSLRWAARVAGSMRWAAIAAAAFPVFLLHSSAFLEQSFLTEQYTLMLALLGAILLVATRAVQVEGMRQKTMLVLLGLLWGLAIGNHPSQVCLGLLVAAAILLITIRRAEIASLGLITLLGFATGLLVFIWVPIRSLADPLMDWGNVETPGRMVWALARRQWRTRSVFDAPAGFTSEWISTYRPLLELGVGGVGLAIVGGAVLSVRNSRSALLLFLGIVPYLFLMLLGHLRQELMDVSYIRQYGISDWHLPLYAGMAALASVGLAAIGSLLSQAGWRVVARGTVWLILLSCASTAAVSVITNSMRHWDAPGNYVRNVTASLPKEAIVVTSSDNLSNMLAYDRYALNEASTRWVGYGVLPVSTAIGSRVRQGEDWTTETQLQYLARISINGELQPLNTSRLHPDAILSRPLFADYKPESKSAGYMLPHGFLFSVHTTPTTNEQVLEREQSSGKKLLKFDPEAHYHRLEREAYGLLYQNRGGYFVERRMWSKAYSSYREALRWLPENGEMWFVYADVCERQNLMAEAVAAYRRAIRYAPALPGPRVNLAVLLLQAGQYMEPEALLREELKIDPASRPARVNLNLLLRNRGQVQKSSNK